MKPVKKAATKRTQAAPAVGGKTPAQSKTDIAVVKTVRAQDKTVLKSAAIQTGSVAPAEPLPSKAKKSVVLPTPPPAKPASVLPVATSKGSKTVLAPSAKPVTPPVKTEVPKPAAKPVAKTEVKATPISSPVTKPAAAPVTQPVARPVTLPVKAEPPKSAAKPVAKTEVKAAPISSPVAKPVAAPVSKLIAKPVTVPVKAEAPKPAAASIAKKAVKAARPKKSVKRASQKEVLPAIIASEPMTPRQSPKEKVQERETYSPRKGESPFSVANIPSILFEGDHPLPPLTHTAKAHPVEKPVEELTGQPAAETPADTMPRFELGVLPPPPHSNIDDGLGTLPESYGTERLLLTARDPHWLYAAWDLNQEQLRRYNAQSADRHLVLRVYIDAVTGAPHNEIHLHPDSRDWFVHVGRGGTKYVSVLGLYDTKGNWVAISTSSATFTPPDTLSEDTTAQFATIPAEVSFDHLLSVVQAAVQENVPLAEALVQIRATEYHQSHQLSPQAGNESPWTPEHEQALADIIDFDSVRRVWMGSMEITELIRRKLARERVVSVPGVSALGALPVSLPSSPMGGGAIQRGELGSPAAPFGAPAAQKPGKPFWFNINAELIIFGATEPDAKVIIAGRDIQLRPDGSFSYRFALPDGAYALPAVAISAEGSDKREARLEFSRQTGYRGEVLAHPQDPALKPPTADGLV